jgi:hypothetical protein|tara:strand:- start:690 stop:830 length:141 start_codon:yes stop_codon:yes gene_type:complete
MDAVLINNDIYMVDTTSEFFYQELSLILNQYDNPTIFWVEDTTDEL